MKIPEKVFEKLLERTIGKQPYCQNTLWWAKDCCLMCIAHPIESTSIEKYFEKYPPDIPLEIGMTRIYLCRHHAKEVINQLKQEIRNDTKRMEK